MLAMVAQTLDVSHCIHILPLASALPCDRLFSVIYVRMNAHGEKSRIKYVSIYIYVYTNLHQTYRTRCDNCVRVARPFGVVTRMFCEDLLTRAYMHFPGVPKPHKTYI